MSDIFTYKDDVEGKVGIGRLPEDLKSILDDISKEYDAYIPDKNASTHHIWFNDMTPSIREKVEKIQKHAFWNKLCDGSEKCTRVSVGEMDELYYSNFKKTSNETNAQQNLYGATANIVIHRDCQVCSFSDVKLYRIIIGLSHGNNNIHTKFTNLNVGQYINHGDYVVFDFARTMHQVVKDDENIETPRTLLKLHFMVCEDCKEGSLDFYRNYFVKYESITRYIMSTGTDPTTFYQFFVGILCQMYYVPYIQYILFVVIIILLVVINGVLKIKLTYKNMSTIIKYVAGSLIFMYILLVVFYWLRYKLFGIK